MSEVTITPPAPNTISVTNGTPAVVEITNNAVYPITVTNTGTFTLPFYYLGVSQVLGTANQISVSTVSNVATVSIPNTFITPDDCRVLGDFRVDGISTINGTMTVTSGIDLIADVGGDLQGSLPNPTVHRIKNIDIHNNPSNGDVFQYLTSNNKYHWVSLATAGIAAASHTHSGADITSGTVAFARLPTGTTSSTVAIGNHTHSGADITSGTVAAAYLGTHTHSGADITSGTVAAAYLGAHTHSIDDLTDFEETKIYVETECNSAGEFSSISVNSGTNSFASTSLDTNGHYGILDSGTSTSTNATAGIGSAQATDMICLGGFKHHTTAILRIPTLSDGTNTFFIEHGFSDNRSGTATDGAYITYSHGTNSGKWQGVVYSNTTASTYDLGITVAAGTWYKLKIVVPTDRSVEFYVDGVLKATAPAGTAPNGVTSASRCMGLHTIIRKSAGSTARNVLIDYVNLQIDTTR